MSRAFPALSGTTSVASAWSIISRQDPADGRRRIVPRGFWRSWTTEMMRTTTTIVKMSSTYHSGSPKKYLAALEKSKAVEETRRRRTRSKTKSVRDTPMPPENVPQNRMSCRNTA